MGGTKAPGLVSFLRQKAKKRTGRIVGGIRRFLGLKYRSALCERDIFELVRGKSVALVGNARSLGERYLGAAIDAHGIVVRFNAAPIPDPRSHGARTDVIATSIELERDIMVEKGASHILWMSPPQNALPGWMVRLPTFFLYPEADHRALCRTVCKRPTTGLMLVDLLQRSPCRSVSLYGFDFYKSPSLSNSASKDGTPHDYRTEEGYIKALIERDRRFSLN